MTKSSTFAKGALAAAAGLAALAVAASASAQPYSGGYDPCRREASNRGVTGGLLGAGAGAVIGSQFAASGHRRDGSLLGGVIGAIAGASIGHSTAACDSSLPPPPPPRRYDDAPPPPPPPAPEAYYAPQEPEYGPAAYGPPPAYGEREVWVYGRHGARFHVIEDRVGPDGCTLADSPVYLPDGRVDRRYVRVCPDRHGRYHVVD